MPRLRTRISPNGYKEYYDSKRDTWIPVHRQAAKNKYGGIPNGKVIHHIDGDKLNNSYSNLAHVSRTIHGRIHGGGADPAEVCFRCGREGHWAKGCKNKTDYRGQRIKE